MIYILNCYLEAKKIVVRNLLVDFKNVVYEFFFFEKLKVISFNFGIVFYFWNVNLISYLLWMMIFFGLLLLGVSFLVDFSKICV